MNMTDRLAEAFGRFIDTSGLTWFFRNMHLDQDSILNTSFPAVSVTY